MGKYIICTYVASYNNTMNDGETLRQYFLVLSNEIYNHTSV